MKDELKIIELAEETVHENIQQFLDSYKLLAGHEASKEDMEMMENIMKNLERKIIDDLRESVEDEFS